MTILQLRLKPLTQNLDFNCHFDRASALISRDSLVSILQKLVDVASPTGEEAELARDITAMLNDFDLCGLEQKIDGKQSNAIGKIAGKHSDSGNNLLLYAPIDTVTSSSAEEDLPWLAAELPAAARAKSRFDGKHLFGLGASNPKGHAACIIEAARTLRAAGIALNSDLLLGFGAGGMPTNARATGLSAGHGIGCQRMLELGSKQGFQPDSALIAKSGWAVSWQEVGLIWFEVSVEGAHNYVGSRHLMPYKNPILDAAALMQKLDIWLQACPEKHRSGLVAPQGVIAFIESGWQRMPAFTPALCRFRVDLRLCPKSTPDEAEQQFAAALKLISEELGITAHYKRLIAIPGTTTDAQQAIIQTSIQSWEAVTNKQHQPITSTSGATDANILRAHGLPTARVGLPKANLANMDFQLGMNAVSLDDLYQFTQLLIHIALSVCGISQQEVLDG